jgi:hypothetical protein
MSNNVRQENTPPYFDSAPTLEQIAAWVAIWNAIAQSIEPKETTGDAQSWLDTIMDADEAAKWLGMCKAKVLKAASGPRPKIIGFRINERVIRFHPRTVLAKLAADAKVPLEIIAASYGNQPDRGKNLHS